jgi:hypothetical protein
VFVDCTNGVCGEDVIAMVANDGQTVTYVPSGGLFVHRWQVVAAEDALAELAKLG